MMGSFSQARVREQRQDYSARAWGNATSFPETSFGDMDTLLWIGAEYLHAAFCSIGAVEAGVAG
jgi:hypothetical protein